MQIRIGNKQDEPLIHALVADVLSEYGQEFDLNGVDSDLRNIEGHYFGADGAFFVIDENKRIVAIGAVRKLNENTCLLKRLCVARDWRGKGLGTKLLNMVLNFAFNLDYETVEAHRIKAFPGYGEFLAVSGFSICGDEGFKKNLSASQIK